MQSLLCCLAAEYSIARVRAPQPGAAALESSTLLASSRRDAGIATGAAYAAKYLKTGQVAVCFFGEGALGQGLLYEELNLAQLWKLPVVFVCENNGYAFTVPFAEMTHQTSVAAKAAGYGMPGFAVDGQDVVVTPRPVNGGVVQLALPVVHDQPDEEVSL